MKHTKIKDNFLVVSNYNNDISWIPEYTDNYVIYDRSNTTVIPNTIDPIKVIKSPNVGYNFYDYFRFIIDNYDNLPETTIFTKGNAFPRHMSRAYFEKFMNNDEFTPIMDETMCSPRKPDSFIENGLYHEINNNWYFYTWKNKYFSDFNDFLRYVYKNPVLPAYTTINIGATYIIPKKNILKLPKKIYQDMMFFISHCQMPAESHMIERACCILWTSDQEINEETLKRQIGDFVPRFKLSYIRKKTVKIIIDAFMSNKFIPVKFKNNISEILNKMARRNLIEKTQTVTTT